MKKLKMLMPILGTTSLIGTIVPITSCTTTYTVTLYTYIGSFANGKNFTVIQCDGATKLQDIEGYVEPSIPTYEFDGWVDDEGKEVELDEYINGSVVLVAKYTENTEPTDPSNFTTDNWATVVSLCQKDGYVPFANAYCGYEGSKEEEAEAAINEWIVSEDNIRYIGLDYPDMPILTKVRIIGIGQDVTTNNSRPAKFTFEFAEAIATAPFDMYYDSGYCNRWLYENEEKCLASTYLNWLADPISPELAILPKIVTDNMETVYKNTVLTTESGLVVGDETKYSEAKNKLFLLSRMELNDTNYKGADGTVKDAEKNVAKNIVYTYYASEDQTEEHEQSKLRIKNYAMTQTPANYWTRSPYLDDYDYDIGIQSKDEWEMLGNGARAVAGVVYDGGIFATYPSYTALGIAPAFCIGEETT